MMLGLVLGDAIMLGFTWLLRLPAWGRCGWASLSPDPSYGLWLSDEGTTLPVRRCPILSCYCGWWCLSEGCEAPGLGYLMVC
jgi:hypothetical protein